MRFAFMDEPPVRARRRAPRRRPSLEGLERRALMAAGDLDPTFSGDGWQTIDFGLGANFGQAMVLQADRKVVVAGSAGNDFAVARLRTDGSLDPTFSGDGKVLLDFGGIDVCRGVAVQRDGKIILAGTTSVGNNFAIARLNPNGTLDPTFSGDGKAVVTFGGTEDCRGVAIQSDGRIVLAGVTSVGQNMAVARLLPNGSLDSSFSGDGRQSVNFGGNEEANAVCIQPNGRIVVAGSTNLNYDMAVARLLPNGALDTTFSGDGRQRITFGATEVAFAVTNGPNGRIIVAGTVVTPAAAGNMAIARLLPNGSLDAAFSADGRQAIEFGANDFAFAVAVQSDGKIVVGGLWRSPRGSRFAVGRMRSNGSLDPTFSGDGRLTIGLGMVDVARGMGISPGDGKIVLAGQHDLGAAFAVARLLGH